MALSISLATQIGALFLLVVVGYVLVKTGVLKARDASILSKLVLYMCAPAAIIIAFQIELTPSRMQGFLLALGGSCRRAYPLFWCGWLIGSFLAL